MLRQSSQILAEARPRLDAVAQQNPEWHAWLGLLKETLAVLDEPVWAKIVPQIRSERSVAAPLLDSVVLTVDSRWIRRWVARLVKRAATNTDRKTASLSAIDLDHLDAIALLEAVACQDHANVAALAERVNIDSYALAAVAQLAAMPLLQACGRHLASQVPLTWTEGYCPICGAWPTLAEIRGLERTRKLRCARCGGEWGSALLRCVYCAETDPQRLGFLLEGSDETRKVETCATCKGYLKTLTTLQGSPGYAVVLNDLATVDLDIVALERGYTRPARPGYPVRVRLVEPPSRLRTFLRWRS